MLLFKDSKVLIFYQFFNLTNPLIPNGSGSYSDRIRIAINPTDFVSDDDNTIYNRVVVQDYSLWEYSYGGTYFKSSTAQELFVYKEIPHQCKLVALKINTVHRTTQYTTVGNDQVEASPSGQELEIDIYRVTIIFPSEIKKMQELETTPTNAHTNSVVTFTNSADEAFSMRS